MNGGSSRLTIGASLQQDGSNFNLRHLRGDDRKLGLRAGCDCSRLTCNRFFFNSIFFCSALKIREQKSGSLSEGFTAF